MLHLRVVFFFQAEDGIRDGTVTGVQTCALPISDWVTSDSAGPPTRPELAALTQVPVLCVYGEGESDSICPQLSASGIAREQIGRGHHFSGEYAALADRILAFARSAKL